MSISEALDKYGLSKLENKPYTVLIIKSTQPMHMQTFQIMCVYSQGRGGTWREIIFQDIFHI